MQDIFIRAAIELMERGVVPDRMMRVGMRHLCKKRLDNHVNWQDELQKFVGVARDSDIALVPDKANEQHYEVPSEFFGLVLGPHRKYSCCYWPDGVQNLGAAEAAALELTCDRAQLADGMSVLELGCGWGSLTLWMAEHYPQIRITAVSNSNSQRKYIEDQARLKGVHDRISVITADMNDFESDQRFDRVVSLEMFEHMRNHEHLMRKIASWLTDAGKLFVHIFCHREQVYPFLDEGASNWMTRYFFTGGVMPSRELLLQYDQDLDCEQSWEWNGVHYQRTQDAWLKRMDDNRAEVLQVLQATYGNEADRWFHRWRMFFLACSELFGFDGGNEWFVAHYLFSPAASKASRFSETTMSV